MKEETKTWLALLLGFLFFGLGIVFLVRDTDQINRIFDMVVFAFGVALLTSIFSQIVPNKESRSTKNE
jgi:hypothetical protein